MSGLGSRVGTGGLVANPLICSAEQSNDVTSTNRKHSNCKHTLFYNADVPVYTCVQSKYPILPHFYSTL